MPLEDEGSQAQVLELTEQGFYEIRGQKANSDVTVIASNVDPAESDLTSMDPAGDRDGGDGGAGANAQGDGVRRAAAAAGAGAVAAARGGIHCYVPELCCWGPKHAGFSNWLSKTT